MAKKFEPRIYNYCDRWCEKCSKTEGCRLWHDEQVNQQKMIEQGIDPESEEGQFKTIEDSLKGAHELIFKMAKEKNIDLSMSLEAEKEYVEFERKTDPKNKSLYKKANRLMKLTHEWLKSVPSLDIPEYQDAYDKVSWHHTFLNVKTARAVRSYLESQVEKGESKIFSLQDAHKSAYVALRSAKICQDSFEMMDTYVVDSRIRKIIENLSSLIERIERDIIDKTHQY